MATKVVVGLSGGVDSAVTAALLQQQGYTVLGLTMNQVGQTADIADAQQVAQQLGIELHVLDYQREFQTQVIDRYLREQQAGLTPNPCCWCNPNVKFACLLRFADQIGAPYVATGHYAQVKDGQLWRGVDPKKDQSYFLAGLQPAQLARIIFPLGGYTKNQVRTLAAQFGLHVHQKPDSSDLCFAVAQQPLTVGQRVKQGGRPTKMYYLGHGRVGPADDPALYRSSLVIKAFNFLVAWDKAITCTAKVRSTQIAVAATAEKLANGDVQVQFAAPVRAVTPGQWCVLYRGDQVLGGGMIND